MSKLWSAAGALVVIVVLLDVLAGVVSAHAALFVGVALVVLLLLALIRIPRRRSFGRPY